MELLGVWVRRRSRWPTAPRRCASKPSIIDRAGRTIVEPLNVKLRVSEQTNLDLRWICRIVDVEKVPEEQRSRHGSCLPFQRPVPLALRGPSAVECPILAKDVGSKLPTGQVRNQVTPIDSCNTVGRSHRKPPLVGHVTPVHKFGFQRPSSDGSILLWKLLGTRQIEHVMNPPGFAGDSVSWEGWGHVEKIWELPEGAAGPCCSDGGGGSVGACFGVGGH